MWAASGAERKARPRCRTHAGLHDGTAMAGKEPAAAECGAASAERRVAIPRGPPAARRIRAVMTGFPGRTQHLVDEAPAAAMVADASQPNIEFVIAAVHEYGPPGVSERPVPE